MIEGLFVTVSGSEVVNLAKARAAELLKKAEALKAKLATIDEISSPNKSFNPAEEARQKIGRYESSAAELVFIADHILVSETYQLQRSDLTTLGIIKSLY